MKQVKKPVFFIVFILIAVFTYFAIAGFSTFYGDVETVHVRGVKDIRWGIDIRGGVDVTFTPSEDAVNVTNDDLEGARAMIETRMVAKNITDYEIYVDLNSKRIICRFPWQSGDDSFDPEQAVKELGETALLTFRKGYSGQLTGDQTYEDLELVLSGSDVAKATPAYDQQEHQWLVSLELNESGKEAFKNATEEAYGSGGRISIWMDDDEISAHLKKILDKEAGDRSGLIYGMGHAVYTYSDPRAEILRESAAEHCDSFGMRGDFELLCRRFVIDGDELWMQAARLIL